MQLALKANHRSGALAARLSTARRHLGDKIQAYYAFRAAIFAAGFGCQKIVKDSLP